MAHLIEETFDVHAPAAAVWDFLVEPRRLVPCLPGAILKAVHDDGSFSWTTHATAGRAFVAYDATAVVVERDDEARELQLDVEGASATGAQRARATVVATVMTPDIGTTRVRMLATVDDAPDDVAPLLPTVGWRRLFRTFAAAMRETLEAPPVALPAGFRLETTDDHPALRDTMAGAGIPVDALLPPRVAGAVVEQRESAPAAAPFVPRTLRAARAALDDLARRITGRRAP